MSRIRHWGNPCHQIYEVQLVEVKHDCFFLEKRLSSEIKSPYIRVDSFTSKQQAITSSEDFVNNLKRESGLEPEPADM